METPRRRRGGQSWPGTLTNCSFSLTLPTVCSALEDIERRARQLLAKGTAARFVDKAGDSGEVVRLVERLQEAIIYYQVSGSYFSFATNTTRRRKGVPTTSDLRPNHRPRREDFLISLYPLLLMVGPFVKSSFDTLLKHREVTRSTKSVTLFTDTGIGVPGDEEQVGVCYSSARSAVLGGGGGRAP